MKYRKYFPSQELFNKAEKRREEKRGEERRGEERRREEKRGEERGKDLAITNSRDSHTVQPRTGNL